VLKELLDHVSSGRSEVLVVRGDPGIGKTTLLDQAVEQASGFLVARATGVESEMELAYAGLHQLCRPMLDRLTLLPAPQREAAGIAFGIAAGRSPDRFLVGLAVLSLLSEVSEQAPVLCVVDDAQWLDRASAQVLAFVARRLLAERVGLLFATRDRNEDLQRLPELLVEGLAEADARALLASVLALRLPLDEGVRERIIAEAHGNPLALVEWPEFTSPAELAGGFGLPTLRAVSGRLEDGFRRRLADLPVPTQRFLTVAAAEPTGDPALVWRAAARLGAGAEDASPAVEAGLVELWPKVSFRHPLVRSVAYRIASIDDRREVHRALAEATDPDTDPDHRAWHRALAAPGPDEEVAADLERSAGRARARGGLAAAASLLERSAALTADAAHRAGRTIAAAGAYLAVGAFESAEALLAAAEAGPLDELSRARIERLRGLSASAHGDIRDAATLLLSAAKRLERIDVVLARNTYVLALGAAVTASDLARGADLAETAKAAKAAPAPPHAERPHDLLLDGLATFTTGGPAAAAPTLRRALSAFRATQLSPNAALGWLGYQAGAATLLWDYPSFRTLAEAEVKVARDLGALTMLPWGLGALAMANIWGGDLPVAASLVGEAEFVIEATRSSLVLFAAAQLAGLRGHERDASAVIEATVTYARARGQGQDIKIARSGAATLYNGLGRYDQALIAALEAYHPPHHWSTHLSLHELVEAASRCGQPALAADAMQYLCETTSASDTDWAGGIQARCRALLSTGPAAEALYREAITRLTRTPVRPEAARAHLLYGEWLRRDNRRVEARLHLRSAYEQLSTIGMDAFADRASRELAATGETVRKRTVETTTELTPQEIQVARLAADGRSNPEIGAQLFISARTVEWHLRKVFTKLNISSRRELRESVLRPVHARR
jgi:DNA-binding CsgD family transcriptional regulator/tetratricopeptide (TPR) repeat protein